MTAGRANWGRRGRIALAVLLIAVVGDAMAPHLLNHFAASAVVTAPVSVIRSPIEGRLAEAPGAPGDPVKAGERLALVERTEADDARMRALAAEEGALAGALAGLDDQIAAAERRLARFRAEDAAVLALHHARLEAEVAERDAEARRLAAELELAELDLARADGLTGRGHAAAARLEAATAARDALRAGLEAARARADQSRARLAAAGRGFLLFDGGVDRTEAARQRDYAEARLEELARERARLAAELEAARRNRATEREAFAERARFAPVSPVDGVVWTAPPPAGRPVLPGDVLAEVLDCRARQVEALVKETLAARIAPGDAATVQVRGRPEPIPAVVLAVAGPGAGREETRLAARPGGDPAGRLRVSLRLAEGALAEDPGRFCLVGLPAEVRFPREATLALRVAAASLTALAERGARAVAAALGAGPEPLAALAAAPGGAAR